MAEVKNFNDVIQRRAAELMGESRPNDSAAARIRNYLQPITILLDPDTVHLLHEVDAARAAVKSILEELEHVDKILEAYRELSFRMKGLEK